VLIPRCLLIAPLVLVQAFGIQSWASDTPTRTAVPSAEKQKEVQAQLDESLGLSKAKTRTARQEAVSQLSKMASDPGVSPDELYVILKVAIPLAKELEDFAAYRALSTQISSAFEVDPGMESPALLLSFISSCKTTAAMGSAVQELIKRVEEQITRDEYPSAIQWLEGAERAARKQKAGDLLTLISKTKLGVTQRQEAFRAHQKAMEVLTNDPDEPKANLAEGQWLVLNGDWSNAITRLARSSDPKWLAAATAELSAGEGADSQLKAADAWWEVAQTAGPSQAAVRLRALDWYVKAEPVLSSPISRTRAAKRKSELAALLKIEIPDSGLMKKSGGDGDEVTSEVRIPVGKAIDLLALVKFPDDVVGGNWAREPDGSLVSESSGRARFQIPVVVAGNYQIRVRFNRKKDIDTLAINLPIGDRSCQFFIDGWYGTLSGIQLVDGKEGARNTPETVSQPKPLELGVDHELLISVAQSDNSAEILAKLNGSDFFRWKGKPSQLSMTPVFMNINPRFIGVVAMNTTTAFQKIELRLLPGGRAVQVGDDWKNSLYPCEDSPPNSALKDCLEWKGRKYLISEQTMELPVAQQLAAELKGRLATISSAEEEDMLFQAGQGRKLWLAGWCRKDRIWRDERNRPLKFFGKWGARDGVQMPDNAGGQEDRLVIDTANSFGWDDAPMTVGGYCACIEWGEE
jgi:hypothetical protein